MVAAKPSFRPGAFVQGDDTEINKFVSLSGEISSALAVKA